MMPNAKSDLAEKPLASRSWRIASVAAGALILGSCTGTVLSTEDLGLGGSSANGFAGSSPKISVESVRASDPQSRLGAREHPRILSLYGGSYENPRIERLLATIVGRLVSAINDTERAYQITILDSPSVNAFALPGGYVYVTRGLLALANDSSELAAVIAHEMGHVVASHGVKRNERAKNAKVTGRVVREILQGRDGTNAIPATDKLKLAKFSRNQELEADELGVKIAGKAGFDPYAQARYLESMRNFANYQAGTEGQRDRLDFLSTHPSAPKRIQLARQHAVDFGGTGKRERERYLNGIKGLKYGDTASEGYVRGRTYAHPGLQITFMVPEGYRLDNRKEAIVATGPGELAVRVDAAPLAPNKSLKAYLNSGWIGGLTPAPPVASNINGMEALTGQAAADGWLFDITLLRSGERVYRVIAAAPAGSADVRAAGSAVATTFRKMTPQETANLRPLKMDVTTVAAGQSIEQIVAQKMSWNPDGGAALVRLLNAIPEGRQPNAGDTIKIVVEG
jgi:predicted Zn-dependent protease